MGLFDFLGGFETTVKKLAEKQDVYGLIAELQKRNFSYNDSSLVTDAIVSIGDPAVDPLISLLNVDETIKHSWSIRKRAAVCLGRLKNDKAIDPLAASLDSGPIKEKIDALIALGWSPRNLKERIYFELLNKNWDYCSQQGVVAVYPILRFSQWESESECKKICDALVKISDKRVVIYLSKKMIDSIKYGKYEYGLIIASSLSVYNDVDALPSILYAVGSLENSIDAKRRYYQPDFYAVSKLESMKTEINAIVDKITRNCDETDLKHINTTISFFGRYKDEYGGGQDKREQIIKLFSQYYPILKPQFEQLPWNDISKWGDIPKMIWSICENNLETIDDLYLQNIQEKL